MKKSKMISQIAFAWGLGLMSVAPVWAQTCIKTPSCADLGYTKTEADCAGKTILKCPLDNTQVYCPSDVETLRTYKVGDIYVSSNGVGIGVVISIDSTGMHGRIISTTGYTGTASEALSLCASKNTGGLDWGVASGDVVCSAARNKFIGLVSYTTPCYGMPDDNADYCRSSAVISGTSSGICTSSGFCSAWSICGGCTQHKCSQTSAIFYCEAAF